MNKSSRLKALHDKWLLECACTLKKTATQGVPGHGNADATIIFIGEAPGAKEDAGGKPFVGSAGKFLDEMLSSINMKREDIYITNLVKYRPPENRDPSSKEIYECSLWLKEEVELIDPSLIITLGRYAMNNFFPEKKISESHGEIFTTESLGKTRHLLPLYHPAAALYNGALRETLKKDFKKIPKILKKLEQNSIS